MTRHFLFTLGLLSLLSLPSLSFSQILVELPYDQEEEKIIYQEVVEVDGKSAEELFVAMRLWAVEAFVSSESAIEFEDIDQGIIGGKGALEVITKGMIGQNVKSFIYFGFRLEAKDGRIRYTFVDFVHKGEPDYPYDYGPVEGFYFESKPLHRKNLTVILEQLKETMETEISELKASLQEDDDDW